MALFKTTYTSLEDEKLVSLIGKKDTQAFEVLYARYAKLMYNYFHRMLWKDKEKARDFTQDLFSKLIQKTDSIDESRSFKTWFYSVAHNMCKNEYAKMEVRRTAHKDISFHSDHSVSDNQKMDREQFQLKLQEALNDLDETKRTTFELRFRQEMSIQEISDVMKCSEGTVKSRLFYTLKQLNEKLKVFEGITVWIFTVMFF
ncbi:MAG: sigma-70 family RNA polymerase sigma factor [Flavobacteriales bacterium]|nr:sigma-70 family RNA polymerase sigma factor [Flavobacteriales bacterium]